MSIKDIITKKHPLALLDIKYIVVPALIFYVIYVLNLLSTTTSLLKENLLDIGIEIQSLKKENITLKSLIQHLKLDNDSLRSMIEEKNSTIQELITHQTPHLEHSYSHSDEMIQFYIKTAGIIAASILVIYILNSTTSLGLFSMKKILPTKAYSTIQDYTPFFQEKKTYIHRDIASETDWIINIVNEKKVSMSVKPNLSTDFIQLSEFITNLHRNAGTVVQYASNNANPPSQSPNSSTDIDCASIDVSSIPTDIPIDVSSPPINASTIPIDLFHTFQHATTVAEVTNTIANSLL